MITYVPYLVLMLLLLFGGLWVGAALGVAGCLAIWSTADLSKLVKIIGTQSWSVNTNFALIALPLFILMGEIMSQSGMIKKIYKHVSVILHGLPGTLLHSNIFSCAVFAACSGSSIASAAAIGSIGYPVQKKLLYDRRLSLGSIAAGGTLGILIPPSIPMIIYAALAEQSLGRLYLAGVVPGAVLSLLFLVYILVCCLQRPSRAPSLKEERVGLRQRLRALADLWQVLLLVVVILGGIYAGVATPTEVAAVGAVLAFILGVCFHGLTWPQFKSATISAIKATSMIMFIVVGAQMLSTSLIFFNVAPKLARFVSSLEVSSLVILAAVSMVYIIMGMFFDGISMMVITIPFVTPILEIMGINLIWFGIYLCILIEIGLITPPVGLNLYVIKGVTDENMAYIIWGAAPFIVPMVLLLFALVIFPGLATWLPGLMNFG